MTLLATRQALARVPCMDPLLLAIHLKESNFHRTLSLPPLAYILNCCISAFLKVTPD